MSFLRLNSKYFVWAFLLICGIAFFWQDMYYYPGADDIFYKFKLDNPDIDFTQQLLQYPHQKIHNWLDIIQSQNVHYICHSGRYLVHVFVQACTSFISRREFVLINSIIFCCLLYCLGYLSNKNNVGKGMLFAAITALILGADAVSTIFCQIAVAINYLWTGTAMVVWMILYEKVISKDKEYSIIEKIGVFFISAVVASLHEGFSIGFGAGIFFNALSHFKSITKDEIILFAGFFIGACVCVFSPGNFGEGGTSGLFSGASHLIYDISTYWILWASLLTLVIFLFASRKETLQFLKINIVYVTVVIVSLTFALVIAYTHSRQLFPVTLSLTILMCRIWQSSILRVNSKIKCCFTLLCIAYCITIYIPMIFLRKDLYEGYNDVMHQLMYTNNRILVADKHDAAVERINNSWMGKSYIYIDGLNYFNSFSLLKTNGKDPNYVEAIIPMPINDLERQYEKMKDANGIAHIIGNTYLYKSTHNIAPKDALWNVITVKYNPYHFWDETISARYKFERNGVCYYVFYCEYIIVKSKNVQII